MSTLVTTGWFYCQACRYHCPAKLYATDKIIWGTVIYSGVDATRIRQTRSNTQPLFAVVIHGIVQGEIVGDSLLSEAEVKGSGRVREDAEWRREKEAREEEARALRREAWDARLRAAARD